MTAGEQTLRFLALALPFLAAAIAPLLVRRLGRQAAWPLALFPAAAFLILASHAAAIVTSGAVLFGTDWIPSYGVRFSFRLDGLSFAFGLLITGIGALIVPYAGGYLAGHTDIGRLFCFIMLFMGSMLGLVLADDLMTLLVFWELTSIASFLLIGFDHHREAARRGAIQALVITGGGGLALMAGLLLVRDGLGLASMTEILAAGDSLRSSGAYVPILVLVLLGAFTKSAQVPFHIWLPNAMEAPTPVSAYLHSATMVKAGVYLLLRLNPALGGTLLWETILPVFGAATLITGATLALRQTDLKLVLAYTTVSSLGLLVMLIGVGSPIAISAAVLYLIAHALFKAGLFMVVGSIDRGAGTRDIRALSGLRHTMPVTFAAALLAALSMAGVTPFFGFLAKEEIFAALATADLRGILLTVAAIAGNALMFAAAFVVALKPFIGPSRTQDGKGAAPKRFSSLSGAPMILGLAGLLAAVASGATHRALSEPMASAAIGTSVAIDISIVPHPGPAFALSLLTIALGIGAYARASAIRSWLGAAFGRAGWTLDESFDLAMRGLIGGAFRVTNVLQSGRLKNYLATTFVVVAAALLIPRAATGTLPSVPDFPVLRFQEWLVVAMLGLGPFAVVLAKTRLTAIVSLGIQGFAVALLYMLMGAPDLAFTQFMVETLSVVILTLVMTRLTLTASDHRPLGRRLPDGLIALACGTGFGLLLLEVTQSPFDNRLSDFFASASATIAHGRNIVNVIIVDFRGLDTMGEIAVVMTTGLAILALVRIRIGQTGGRTNPSTGEIY